MLYQVIDPTIKKHHVGFLGVHHTTKPIYPVTRCHLNAMVADTQKWEQSAAFLLDSHPGVSRWVKNDRLGFFIPYRNRGVPSSAGLRLRWHCCGVPACFGPRLPAMLPENSARPKRLQRQPDGRPRMGR